MNDLTDPTVLSAWIGGAFSIMATIVAIRAKQAASRHELINKTYASQYQGWDKFTSNLMERVGELETELRRKDQEFRKVVADMEAEMRRRDEACSARIRALEARLGDPSD